MQNAGPEMIPMSSGLPNPAMFPFKSASVALSNGQEIRLQGEKLSSALQASSLTNIRVLSNVAYKNFKSM